MFAVNRCGEVSMGRLSVTRTRLEGWVNWGTTAAPAPGVSNAPTPPNLVYLDVKVVVNYASVTMDANTALRIVGVVDGLLLFALFGGVPIIAAGIGYADLNP